jgi:lambda family phage portal protein
LDFGQFYYGNKGEKPEVLESKRPAQNFLNFCDLILRITASSLEIPYEELTKDFSKTTYSSARAALLEAWRVYDVYRTFFVRHYCQSLYQMVVEEAFLRGYLTLPPKAPGFYEGARYWCNARWIGPSRGYIDPLKEINAAIAAINAGLDSNSHVIAERGDDFDEVAEQRAYERDRLQELGLTNASVAAPAPREEEEEDGREKEEGGRNAPAM